MSIGEIDPPGRSSFPAYSHVPPEESSSAPVGSDTQAGLRGDRLERRAGSGPTAPVLADALGPPAASQGMDEAVFSRALAVLERLFENTHFTMALASLSAVPLLGQVVSSVSAALALLAFVGRWFDRGKADWLLLGSGLAFLAGAMTPFPLSVGKVALGGVAGGLLASLRSFLGSGPRRRVWDVSAADAVPLEDAAFERSCGIASDLSAVERGERDFVAWFYEGVEPLWMEYGRLRRHQALGHQSSATDHERLARLERLLEHHLSYDTIAEQVIERLIAEVLEVDAALERDELFESWLATTDALFAEYAAVRARVRTDTRGLVELFEETLPELLARRAWRLGYGVASDPQATPQPGAVWQLAEGASLEALAAVVLSTEPKNQAPVAPEQMVAALRAFNGLTSDAVPRGTLLYVPTREQILRAPPRWPAAMPMHESSGLALRARLVGAARFVGHHPVAKVLAVLARMPAQPQVYELPA